MSTENIQTDACHLATVEVRDFKRIKCVRATFDDGVTIIGGEVEQGKTSILDAIASALGGEKLCPLTPIRRGMSKAKVELSTTDGLWVRRNWVQNDETGKVNSYLTVKVDGVKVDKKQKLLDEIWSRIAIDPKTISRMTPLQRRRMALEIANCLDEIETIARDRKQAFDDRHDLKVVLKQKEGALAEMDEPQPGTPREEVPLQLLMTTLQNANERKNENDAERRKVVEKEKAVRDSRTRIEAKEDMIDQLKNELREQEESLETARANHTRLTGDLEAATTKVEQLIDPDINKIKGEIGAAEMQNKVIRAAIAYDEMLATIRGIKQEVEKQDDRVKSLDDERDSVLHNAEFPLEGMTVNEDDIVFEGESWTGMSGSQQDDCSIAMSASWNPKLRLVLFDEGDNIQGKALERLHAICEKFNLQVVMTSASHNDEAGIIIHDGEIVDE